jgi:uncharacterized repeat protein (TIGR03803 family)
MNLVFDRLRAPLGGLACAALLLSTATHAQTTSAIKPFSTLTFFNGVQPSGNVTLGHDGALYGPTTGGGGAPAGLFYRQPVDAGPIRTIYQYGLTYDADLNRIYLGNAPSGQLLLASDGYFYGVTQSTTPFGGGGTIFRMAQDGTGYTRLYEFASATIEYVRNGVHNNAGYAINSTGLAPVASLIEGTVGGVRYLFGTTPRGGANDAGVVFSFRLTDGYFDTLHHFGAADTEPVLNDAVPPVQATTSEGVPIVAFRTNPDGQRINLDGLYPDRRLLLASDNRLYGVTKTGGANGTGVIFSLTTNPAGSDFRSINFDPSPPTVETPPADPPYDPNDTTGAYYGYNKRKLNESGSYPASSLVQIGDYVYGTTSTHGAYPDGSTGPQYSTNAGYGTMFRVDTTAPTPAIEVVFNFTGSVNNSLYPGAEASGDLTVVNGTDIVGTAQFGGILTDIADNTSTDDTPGVGLVYRVNTATTPAQYTQVFVFGADTRHSGASPGSGVIAVPEGSDYAYYGITQSGGAWGYGTVFKLGDPVANPAQGTPQPFDDGGGSIGKWLIAALLLLAAVQLIALRHRRLRLKRVLARQL